MCRNIPQLHISEPPTTEDGVRAAAIRFVRKVSGALHHAPAVPLSSAAS
ncbi:DUF2277 family protein [Raineyella fluvialis]|uniref:DUF2277 family protein n=1 Tax=Raineyella fluvialis TaxID=2662261 RepID=A0A5Q2FB42_9ACTN|nr:DUF2277 family protein [Raineyella fluvialis]QGF22624.1 DUF2277 family protein [Raineyella fluvialis]